MASAIVFPVDASDEVIKSQSPNRWCFGRLKNGHHDYNAADIFAPTGTRILSPVAGTITRAKDDSSGVGSRVQIRDDTGRLWYLAHMDNSPGLQVVKGQRVSPGALIGVVGTSAHARGTQPHLHIDMLPSSSGSGERPSCSGPTCQEYPFENIQPLLIEAYTGRADEQPLPPLGNGSVIARDNGDGTYLEAILGGGHAFTLSGQDKIDLGLGYARVIDAAEFNSFITGPIADGSVFAKNVGGAWTEAVMGGGHAFLLSAEDKIVLGLGAATGIPVSHFDWLIKGPIADGSVFAKNVGGAWSEAILAGNRAFELAPEDNALLGLGRATGIPVQHFDWLAANTIAERTVVARRNPDDTYLEAYIVDCRAVLLTQEDKVRLGLGVATVIPTTSFNSLLP